MASVAEGRAKSLGLEFCFRLEKPVQANRRVLAQIPIESVEPRSKADTFVLKMTASIIDEAGAVFWYPAKASRSLLAIGRGSPPRSREVITPFCGLLQRWQPRHLSTRRVHCVDGVADALGNCISGREPS
jgi:hypothetical protein